MRHMVCAHVPISREKNYHLELQVLLIISWLVTMQTFHLHASGSIYPWIFLLDENSIYYQIVIPGNSSVSAILRNFYGKVYITFQLLQFIINNYVRVRVLVDCLNLEPTPTLIFLNWYFSNPSQTLTYSKFILQLKPYVGYGLDRLKLQSYSHMHKIVQILFDLQNVW